MTKRKKLVKHLQRYKDIYTLCVSIIAAVSTFICSLISIGVLRNQNIMQSNMNQPIFSVYTAIACDKKEDDIKGTEYLFVENNGQKYVKCDVDEKVFFSLEKDDSNGTNTKVIVEIPDYFFVGHPTSSQQSSVVYMGEGLGSNRYFGELYRATLNTEYMIRKIILVKISYTDIYNEKHVKYYNKNGEIEKNEYDNIVAMSEVNNGSIYRIDQITFQKMKELLQRQEESKKK